MRVQLPAYSRSVVFMLTFVDFVVPVLNIQPYRCIIVLSISAALKSSSSLSPCATAAGLVGAGAAPAAIFAAVRMNPSWFGLLVLAAPSLCTAC